MTWTLELARPLKPASHPTLLTLADARAYVHDLPEDVSHTEPWIYAADLLQEAAESADFTATLCATDQLEQALFLANRLDPSERVRIPVRAKRTRFW